MLNNGVALKAFKLRLEIVVRTTKATSNKRRPPRDYIWAARSVDAPNILFVLSLGRFRLITNTGMLLAMLTSKFLARGQGYKSGHNFLRLHFRYEFSIKSRTRCKGASNSVTDLHSYRGNSLQAVRVLGDFRAFGSWRYGYR